MRRMLVFVVLLAALGLFPETLNGQGTSDPGRRPRAQVRQNYPNPFNPETTIPFDVFEEDVNNGQAVVTIRIFNALKQLVAVPRAKNHPDGEGGPVMGLKYTTPNNPVRPYEAYWDGTDKNGRKVASGVYYASVEVNGERRYTIRMVVNK